MNGAESLVRTLLAGGVNVCFTNPGTSEMHFCAALDKVENGDIRGEPHQIVMSGDATSVQVLRTVLALLAPKADPSDADDAPGQGAQASAASSSGVDGTTATHGGASAPAPGTASETASDGAGDPASGQQAAAAATAADGPVDTSDPRALQAALRRMARREALQRHPDLPAAATAVAWTLASILDEDAGWAAINFYFSHALVSAQRRLKDWLVYVVASAMSPCSDSDTRSCGTCLVRPPMLPVPPVMHNHAPGLAKHCSTRLGVSSRRGTT